MYGAQKMQGIYKENRECRESVRKVQGRGRYREGTGKVYGGFIYSILVILPSKMRILNEDISRHLNTTTKSLAFLHE